MNRGVTSMPSGWPGFGGAPVYVTAVVTDTLSKFDALIGVFAYRTS